MQPQTSRQQILSYILLVFVLNVPFDYFMIRAHSIRAGGLLYAWGIMWCPALAAIAVLKLNGRKLSELGWGWGKPKYQAMAWLIPLLYASISYVIVWAGGLGGVPNPEFVQRTTSEMALNLSPSLSMVIYVLLTGSLGLVIQVSATLGEEIGWRGFMVPELAKTTSFTLTALISGAVWAVGHYPSLLFSDYNGGTPGWFGIPCFTVGIVAMSFVLAWLSLRSGSLWTATIMHASHNLYIQDIFTPLTRMITPRSTSTEYTRSAILGVWLALVGWTPRFGAADIPQPSALCGKHSFHSQERC